MAIEIFAKAPKTYWLMEAVTSGGLLFWLVLLLVLSGCCDEFLWNNFLVEQLNKKDQQTGILSNLSGAGSEQQFRAA